LRNINHFIANCTNPNLSEEVRNSYIGIARFFRAWFYYDMVTRFGDVPWIDKPLTTEDEALYAPRDSRTLVMEKVMEDLDFAYANISATSSDGTTITIWTARGLKTGIALFEGTYRKYNEEIGIKNTAETYLQYVVDAEIGRASC